MGGLPGSGQALPDLLALAAIRGPEIHLEIGDVLSPVVVKDPAQPTAMFVVMPIRLD